MEEEKRDGKVRLDKEERGKAEGEDKERENEEKEHYLHTAPHLGITQHTTPDNLSCDLITVMCLKFMIHDSVQLFLIFPPSLSPILSSLSSVSFIKQCKVKERCFITVLRRVFETLALLYALVS